MVRLLAFRLGGGGRRDKPTPRMGMSPEDAKKFMQHLVAVTRGRPPLVCPVCGGDHFTFEGPVAPMVLGALGQLGPDSMPTALVVCMTCFNIRSFAWRPIADGKERL